MSKVGPEVGRTPSEDPHVMIAEFLDKSVQMALRYRIQSIWLSTAAKVFGTQPLTDTDANFKLVMDASRDTVNNWLEDLGGIPVTFHYEPADRYVSGRLIRCKGYNPEAQHWELDVLEGSLSPIYPGRPMQGALYTLGFGQGELLESYQRAIE